MRPSFVLTGLVLLSSTVPAMATTYKIDFSGTVNPQFDPNFVGTDYSFHGDITYVYNPADVASVTSTGISYQDKSENALETASLTIAGLNGGKPLPFTGPDIFDLFAGNFNDSSGPSQNYNVYFSSATGEIDFQFDQMLATPIIPISVTTPFSISGNITGVGSYAVPGNSYGDELDATLLTVSISNVPLPASAPMFGAGLLALCAVGYGLKRKTNSVAA